ncbi:hypothetical protein [Nocardia iowensis]|uniref:Extradiol ring-cleavage dioxygenase class III enzyme subunit B domain-containing protein n=1 Tax=Nocardia iowensis TaxID=204891 RepID=A0ABX8RGU1_NOCIO|nr:hypothetical protein [Nocardia iowensis]QXN88810.1 hypothetical protein KV110_24870 [Nocardia iowensis]
MALISAAVCPHPPGLIPDVAGEAASQWDQLRAACAESVRRLDLPQLGIDGRAAVFEGFGARPADETTPELVVIVGGDDTTRTFHPAGAYPSLRAHGIDWWGGWGQDHDESAPLPLSLSLGYWLLDFGRPPGVLMARVEYQAVSFDASPQDCARLGWELAGRAGRVAMLVMGEGSAVRGVTVRPHPDERSGRYDAEVAAALGEADTEGLGWLDPALSNRLNATGRAAWQVLAGAADGQRFQAELLAGPASSGVGYFVATWTQGS